MYFEGVVLEFLVCFSLALDGGPLMNFPKYTD